AALDQRPLPGDASPRDQPQRRRALRAGLLLRRPDRLADCRGTDLRWAGQAAEVPDDLLYRLHGRLSEADLRPAAASRRIEETDMAVVETERHGQVLVVRMN